MNYNPNWNDPRVRKRLERAITWADLHLLPWRAAEASSDVLNGVFGTQTNPLSKYLREKLLTEESASYRVGHYSKRYFLNQRGRAELEAARCSALPTSSTASTSWAVDEYGTELATFDFQYTDKSERLWHPLQNVRRELKQHFWTEHGLPFNYDIAACAPTILFQLARKSRVPQIVLEELKSYLDDRSSLRTHVAELVSIDLTDAKRLINSLFNGAKLGANSRWAAFKLLSNDEQKMSALVADPKVRKLRADIARVWRAIERTKRAETMLSLDATLAGAQQANWKLTSPRDKWALYFRYERQVLEAIKGYLKLRGIAVFTEHDGFRTNKAVDQADLQDWIKETTGFEMVVEQA